MLSYDHIRANVLLQMTRLVKMILKVYTKEIMEPSVAYVMALYCRWQKRSMRPQIFLYQKSNQIEGN